MPKLLIPKEGEAMYELYNLDEDPGETTNLYFENPDVVEKLKERISEIILNGRSTPGNPQEYVKENWEQVSWMEP